MSDTPIADMVAQMLSGGIPPELIVLAVKTAERCAAPKADATAERRRAWDRARKAGKNSTGIPPDHENASSLTSLPTSEESKGKKEKKEVAKRNFGRRLPDEWAPSDEHFAEGERLGKSRSDVVGEAADMRLWARSNEHRAIARKSDWDATFMGWIRRNVPRRSTGPPLNGSHAGRHDNRQRTANAYAKLADYADADPDDEAGGRGDGEASFGLLPFAKLARS